MAGLKNGNPARKSPSPTSTAARLAIFHHGADSVALDNASDTPTMKRKKGKMRSVGVQPCHSACSSGQYIASQVPGLFTTTIAAMVNPRNASRESTRSGTVPLYTNPWWRRFTSGCSQRTIPNQMNDTLGRPLRNLRLSVTDRCNLRCQVLHAGGRLRLAAA